METKSARTRREILAKAVDLASVEGLESLTIGRLAAASFMSKSGVFACFGSKEELQLAVVGAAREVFEREVITHAATVENGLARLLRMTLAWIRYLERGHFRGGCFFSAAALEVDDRPGRIRDLVVDLTRTWAAALETEAAEAVARGELGADADPGQIAFELHAFLQHANWAFQLQGDGRAFERAAAGVRRALETHTTGQGRRLLDAHDW